MSDLPAVQNTIWRVNKQRRGRTDGTIQDNYRR